MAGTTSDKLALLRQIKEAFRAAITGKGQTISDDEPYSAWPAKVSAIETGIQLPTLTNPGGAADLRKGKQLIDQAGQIVDGTLEEVQQATPSISVSSSGLITATAGTKSATKQLDSSMDSDFVASNIKSGVSIFGVVGAMTNYKKVGFTEQLNDNAEDGDVSIEVDYTNAVITITPKKVLERYSLDQITGVDNLTIQILEGANSVYHRLELCFYPSKVYPKKCEWLYAWWTGKTAPDNADATIELVMKGNVNRVDFDDATKVATLSGDGDDFETALNTIGEESTTTPSIGGVITWAID